jgi:hypothetical protein
VAHALLEAALRLRGEQIALALEVAVSAARAPAPERATPARRSSAVGAPPLACSRAPRIFSISSATSRSRRTSRSCARASTFGSSAQAPRDQQRARLARRADQQPIHRPQRHGVELHARVLGALVREGELLELAQVRRRERRRVAAEQLLEDRVRTAPRLRPGSVPAPSSSSSTSVCASARASAARMRAGATRRWTGSG